MSKRARHSDVAWDPTRVPQGGSWMSHWHIPPVVERLLPRPVLQSLPPFRVTGRALTPHFSRHTESKPEVEDRQASASMSIVVPIRAAPTAVRRCLASLEQYAPESEIILVDDGSSLTEALEVIQDFSTRNGWKVVQ